jgi:subtilisin family serine protease
MKGVNDRLTSVVFLALLLASPCVVRSSVLTANTAEPWSRKIHPVLARQMGTAGTVEFIVTMDLRADLLPARRIAVKEEKTAFVVERLQRIAEASQASLIQRLEVAGAEFRSFWIANAIWVRGTPDLIDEIARREDVASVDANPKTPHDGPAVRAASQGRAVEWNVNLVGADQVWALGYDGSGIVIGSQDTGFFWDHPALVSSYRGWDGVTADHDYNWHDTITSDLFTSPTCPANAPAPCDDGFLFPHGTYTMGIAVGDDGGANQIGVAPGARWMGCRNSDLGGGTPATYMECFQWLVSPTDLADLNPDPSMAPHVVNNSWACIPAEGCNPDTLHTTIDNVRAAGIVVVAAAGNDGADCETVDYPPAIYDASLTVGATDAADVIGAISSRGPVTIDGSGRLKPDLTAPGINVRSAVGIWDILQGGVYWDFLAADGTSASAPHVAGAVALLLDARPDLIGQVDQIEDLLRATAIPYTSTQPCGGLGPDDSPNHVYGHGRLDLVELFLGDIDSDGTTNVDDCAPNDNAAWKLPDPVDDLQLGGGAASMLSWTQPADPGATTLLYDVLRTTLPGDFSGATCVESGESDTVAQDEALPDEAFYYVVRTVNPCGGNPGENSAGGLRDVPDCP